MKPSSELVKVKINDDVIAFVEATVLPGEEDVSSKLLNFDDATNTIKCLSSTIYNSVKEVGPQQASVEFNLEITLDSGKLSALLVQGSSKANIKVRLQWGS